MLLYAKQQSVHSNIDEERHLWESSKEVNKHSVVPKAVKAAKVAEKVKDKQETMKELAALAPGDDQHEARVQADKKKAGKRKQEDEPANTESYWWPSSKSHF